jgi:hypothetical protein
MDGCHGPVCRPVRRALSGSPMMRIPDITAPSMIAWSAPSPSSPRACRRARCAAWGLTARRGQAKWLTVPLMPRSRCTQTQSHLHRNLLHKTSDIPATRAATRLNRAMRYRHNLAVDYLSSHFHRFLSRTAQDLVAPSAWRSFAVSAGLSGAADLKSLLCTLRKKSSRSLWIWRTASFVERIKAAACKCAWRPSQRRTRPL